MVRRRGEQVVRSTPSPASCRLVSPGLAEPDAGGSVRSVVIENRVIRSASDEPGSITGEIGDRSVFTFEDDGRRGGLPEWAHWMFELGGLSTKPSEPPRRLIAAVAVPCRAFAAVLCGAGCVISQDPLRPKSPAGSVDDVTAYFEYLCSLRPGSTVTVVSGKAKRVGRFVRVEDARGERHLVVEQGLGKKRSFVQYIPLRHAHNVTVRALGLRCLVIGQVSVLEPEIRSGDVSTADGHPLQDVLRVGRFAAPSEKDIRSDVIAASADLPRRLQDARPAVVIFDGAEAFRRWKEAWRSCAWLIVLDRTSRQFDEAVALVEQEFIERRYDDDDPLADLDVAPGIELMSFWGQLP